MKRKKCCGLILVLAGLMLTGCSQEALYELTEEEQQLVVNYSAHMVSKFNTYQKDGLTYFSQENEPEAIIEETEMTENTEMTTGDMTSGGEIADIPEEGISTTLEEVFEDTGLKISYSGCEIADTYLENDIYALKPSYGKTFVILKLTAENEKEEAVILDNMSAGNSFSLKGMLDSGDKYNTPAVMTLLTNDFVTYEGTIEPQAVVDMVLIFEIPEGTTKMDHLVLKINKNDTIFEINL